MINTIITSIIVVFIMFIFTFFILKNVIKRINDSAKRYFIEKLQEYNYLIDEKEEKLNNLRSQIIKQEKNNVKLHLEDDSVEELNIFTPDIERKLEEMKMFKERLEIKKVNDLIYDIPTPEYREESFFNTYKELRKNFKIDNEKIIREFLDSHQEKQEDKKYQALKKFRKQFTDKAIYECLTLSNEEQFSLINEVLTKQVSKIMNFEEKFTNPKQFVITDFINEIDEKIKEYNPNLYVYVGQEAQNYDDIDKRIKTKFYKNMSEGIIIYYKGKIYDYSI